MSKSKCGVYQIKNIENGKIYIGSSKNINQRWRNHIKELEEKRHHNMFLQEDWNKYGKDKFQFSVLEETDELDRYDVEQKYLKEFMPFNRTNRGYNISETSTYRNDGEYKFYTVDKLFDFGKRLHRKGSKLYMNVYHEEYMSNTRNNIIEEYDGKETLFYLNEEYSECNPDWK